MAFKFTAKEVRGKKVVFYGDSITEGCKTTGFHVGFPMESIYAYPHLLSAEMGFEYRNRAIGGSRFTYTTAIKQGCASGVKTIFDQAADARWADIAVVFYGTNDFHGGTPIGKITDTPHTFEDVSTFFGSIDFAIRTLRRQNGNIKICFLTPLYRSTPEAWHPAIVNPETKLHLNDDYGQAVRRKIEATRDENIIYIDMWGCLNGRNFNKSAGNTIDGIHPNDNGHRLIADYILRYYN